MKLVGVIRALRREGRFPVLLVLLAGTIWASYNLLYLLFCSLPKGLAVSWNLAEPDLGALAAFLVGSILSLLGYWKKIEFERLHPHLLDTRNLVIKALDEKKDAPSRRHLWAELEARRIALKKLKICCPSNFDDLQEWSELLNKVTAVSYTHLTLPTNREV